MGIGKLSALAKVGDGSLVGAVEVLRIELVRGCWKSQDEFCEFYPQAVVDGPKARIFLDDDNAVSVDLIVNFASGMVLIKHAGFTIQTMPGEAAKGRAA